MGKSTHGQKTRTVEEAWEEREEAKPVDTSKAGVSATDKKADSHASSARRNLKGDTTNSTKMLEGVEPGQRPSRKSTRDSANRAKGATELTKANTRAVTSPKARATRNQTRC
ncbi:MAG: hypothetical protein R3A52_30630 [Polyangiales bacterium]